MPNLIIHDYDHILRGTARGPVNPRTPHQSWPRTLFIILVILFLFLPIFVLILFSFNQSELNIVFTGFTLDWYQKLWSNSHLLEAFSNTLLIAFISTLTSTILGTIAAIGLKKFKFLGRSFINNLIYIPIIIPEIVLGISLLAIFSLFRVELGFYSILLAHITFSTPFVINSVRSVLFSIPDNIEEAAHDLGAGPWATFFRITLPLLKPGIYSGAILAFTLSLDDVIVSYFTAGPGTNTLPLYIYSIIKTGVTPDVNALTTLMLLATTLLLFLSHYIKNNRHSVSFFQPLITRLRTHLATFRLKFPHLLGRIFILIGSASFVVALSAIAIQLGLRPTSNSAPRESSTLNVLNWTSYIPEEIIDNFEQEYHIRVNYGTYSSNEELLAKIISSTEGAYDVIFPSDYLVSLLKEKDLIIPLDHTKLPNQANLNPHFLTQPYDENNQYSLPFLLATTKILYNSAKTDALTSYHDLLNPALRNNLIFLDDERIVIGAMLSATHYNMNDTNPNHLNAALEFYHQLRPNIKAFDSDSPKTFFITDEVVAGLIWNAEATIAESEHPNLVSVYPEEGFALSMDNYVILKGSKNLDNAYTFINYLLRDDVASQIVATYPYISPNNSALTLSSDELDQIFQRGTYIENVSPHDTRLLDEYWAKMK